MAYPSRPMNLIITNAQTTEGLYSLGPLCTAPVHLHSAGPYKLYRAGRTALVQTVQVGARRTVVCVCVCGTYTCVYTCVC